MTKALAWLRSHFDGGGDVIDEHDGDALAALLSTVAAEARAEGDAAGYARGVKEERERAYAAEDARIAGHAQYCEARWNLAANCDCTAEHTKGTP